MTDNRQGGHSFEAPPGARSIEEILVAARARLARLTPEQAYTACAAGATLMTDPAWRWTSGVGRMVLFRQRF